MKNNERDERDERKDESAAEYSKTHNGERAEMIYRDGFDAGWQARAEYEKGEADNDELNWPEPTVTKSVPMRQGSAYERPAFQVEDDAEIIARQNNTSDVQSNADAEICKCGHEKDKHSHGLWCGQWHNNDCPCAIFRPVQPAEDAQCLWTYDDDDYAPMWNTQCGQAFCFEEGGLRENNFRFCHYCGGQIRTSQPQGEETK